MTVKGHQPTLFAELMTYVADPQAHYPQAETLDRRRGRTEGRTIKVRTEMNAYLAPCWPFVAQVAELTRTVTKAGISTTEVVYLITPLPSWKAGPERLLELNRGQWSIESRSTMCAMSASEKIGRACGQAMPHKFWLLSAISPLP